MGNIRGEYMGGQDCTVLLRTGVLFLFSLNKDKEYLVFQIRLLSLWDKEYFFRIINLGGIIMARVTAKEFQEKHARRLKAAVDDMRKGVERVTESPTGAAAKKVDKMRTNIVASIDSGKWAAGLNRVSLEDWKRAMVEKGVNRVASGIDGAAPKVEAFASQLLPHVDAGVGTIKRLPDVTLEDNINRMTTFIRHMSKFKRK